MFLNIFNQNQLIVLSLEKKIFTLPFPKDFIEKNILYSEICLKIPTQSKWISDFLPFCSSTWVRDSHAGVLTLESTREISADFQGVSDWRWHLGHRSGDSPTGFDSSLIVTRNFASEMSQNFLWNFLYEDCKKEERFFWLDLIEAQKRFINFGRVCIQNNIRPK